MTADIKDKKELHELIRLISDQTSFSNKHDAQHILSLAKDHRIIPRIAKNLPDDGTDLIEGIHKENQLNKFYQLKLVSELSTLNVLFAEIPFIVLKGNLLSQFIYGDPAERMSRDIDLLIDPNNFDSAITLLKSNGYQLKTWFKTPKQRAAIIRHYHHVELVHNEKQIIIEIHWKLTNFRNIDVDFTQLIANTNSMNIGADNYNVLNKFDLIEYLSIHGVFHGFFRLHWLIDLWELKKGLSPKEHENLITHLKETSNFHFYLIALKLMESVFNDTMDSNLEEEFQKSKRSIKIVNICIKRIVENDLYSGESVSRFKKIKFNHEIQYLVGGIKGLIRNLISRNVRPRNWQTFAFPDSVFFLNHLFSRIIWLFTPRNK